MAIPASVALSLAAALVAASCSSFRDAGVHLMSPCTDGVCKADVSVQSCENGTLPVVPDPLPVPSPNNLEWTVVTPGYKFASNGIVVQGTGFTSPHATPNGKKFIVHDDHTDLRTDIKYTVRVIRESDGVECHPNDPLISNQ
ncbi:MAG: hypothetical protein ABI809_06680 [Caldimonas sp.]